MVTSAATPHDVPLPRAAALAIVKPYAVDLAGVIADGWAALTEALEESPRLTSDSSAATRGMLMADLMKQPAHRRFRNRADVEVQERYAQPWVRLWGAGTCVDVRFRRLTPSLALAPCRSERGEALSFHLPDPVLPGMPEATVLTAGYVTNASGDELADVVLVCHLGAEVLYTIDLLGPTPQRSTPTQIPLTPLSDPIIRSARMAARDRLGREGRSNA